MVKRLDNGGTVFYGNNGSIFYRIGETQKANGATIYWLGNAMGQFQDKLTIPLKMADIAYFWRKARESLEYFAKQIVWLPLSKSAALALIDITDKTIARKSNLSDSEVTLEELFGISFSVSNFQTVLTNENPVVSAVRLHFTGARWRNFGSSLSRATSHAARATPTKTMLPLTRYMAPTPCPSSGQRLLFLSTTAVTTSTMVRSAACFARRQ